MGAAVVEVDLHEHRDPALPQPGWKHFLHEIHQQGALDLPERVKRLALHEPGLQFPLPQAPVEAIE